MKSKKDTITFGGKWPYFWARINDPKNERPGYSIYPQYPGTFTGAYVQEEQREVSSALKSRLIRFGNKWLANHSEGSPDVV